MLSGDKMKSNCPMRATTACLRLSLLFCRSEYPPMVRSYINLGWSFALCCTLHIAVDVADCKQKDSFS